jgi:hypothetical protein
MEKSWGSTVGKFAWEMIRCGLKRWDAKDKICQPAQIQSPIQEWGQAQAQPKTAVEQKSQEPTLKKTEAEAALEKLLAERKKLDNYWSQ